MTPPHEQTNVSWCLESNIKCILGYGQGTPPEVVMEEEPPELVMEVIMEVVMEVVPEEEPMWIDQLGYPLWMDQLGYPLCGWTSWGNPSVDGSAGVPPPKDRPVWEKLLASVWFPLK